MTVLLAFWLLADPIQELQGTWSSAAGTVIVIEEDEIWIGKGEEAESRPGRREEGLTGNQRWRRSCHPDPPYKIVARSYLTMDGNEIEHKRKPVRGRGWSSPTKAFLAST
jgi:hypothetical protein